jgi:hypothetical protein
MADSFTNGVESPGRGVLPFAKAEFRPYVIPERILVANILVYIEIFYKLILKRKAK